jgi:acetyl esterase/lipase
VYASGIAAAPRDLSAEEGVSVEHRDFAGADGKRIRVRLYRPERRLTAGVVYHAHGGGLILGDLEMTHARNVQLARELGCLVVSVDYRLAPEWPFPTPVDDVYSGLVWLHDNAGELEIDPSSIVVHGVSAGGGLVAASALMARDRGGPDIRFQVLVTPMLDDRLTSGSSLRFVDTPGFTRRDAHICWNSYLRQAAGGEVSPYAAPVRAADLSDLPPAYISAAEFDPLRDDAILYAELLLQAGVAAELHVYPGTYHGSVSVQSAAVSRRQWSEEVAVLRNMMLPTASRHDQGVLERG